MEGNRLGQHSGPTKGNKNLGSSGETQFKVNQAGSGSNPTVNEWGNTMQAQSSQTNGDGERRGSSSERNRGVKHLPYTEMMDCKTEGLCFCCGKRYTPLYQCAKNHLRLIILSNDEVLKQEGELIAMKYQEAEEETTVGLNSKILSRLLEGNSVLNALLSPLHLAGSVKGMSLTILVETRVSHNFISPQMAENMHLSIDQSKAMSVRLGNGERVKVVGKSERFEIQYGKFSTMLEAYAFELEGNDMVLGVTWLQSLGKVSFDWNEKAVNFIWNGQIIKLLGLFHREKKNDREKQFNRVGVGDSRLRKVARWEGNKEIVS